MPGFCFGLCCVTPPPVGTKRLTVALSCEGMFGGCDPGSLAIFPGRKVTVTSQDGLYNVQKLTYTGYSYNAIIYGKCIFDNLVEGTTYHIHVDGSPDHEDLDSDYTIPLGGPTTSSVLLCFKTWYNNTQYPIQGYSFLASKCVGTGWTYKFEFDYITIGVDPADLTTVDLEGSYPAGSIGVYGGALPSQWTDNLHRIMRTYTVVYGPNGSGYTQNTDGYYAAANIPCYHYMTFQADDIPVDNNYTIFPDPVFGSYGLPVARTLQYSDDYGSCQLQQSGTGPWTGSYAYQSQNGSTQFVCPNNGGTIAVHGASQVTVNIAAYVTSSAHGAAPCECCAITVSVLRYFNCVHIYDDCTRTGTGYAVASDGQTIANVIESKRMRTATGTIDPVNRTTPAFTCQGNFDLDRTFADFPDAHLDDFAGSFTLTGT